MDIVPKTRKRQKVGGGSKKGRQQGHNQQTGKYLRQRNRTGWNKARSRKKHLENHPNDLQAKINIAKAE